MLSELDKEQSSLQTETLPHHWCRKRVLCCVVTLLQVINVQIMKNLYCPEKLLFI